MKIKLLRAALIAAVLCLLPTAKVWASSSFFEISVEAAFDDVSIDIDNAIANRGFVVDFKSQVGAMLNRTAGDVGSNVDVFLHADTWQFCSSVLSREMVEVNPSNIAYCPYIIYAYESTNKPGVVVVGFRQHETEDDDSKAILEAIDEQLEMIVKEATEF